MDLGAPAREAPGPEAAGPCAEEFRHRLRPVELRDFSPDARVERGKGRGSRLTRLVTSPSGGRILDMIFESNPETIRNPPREVRRPQDESGFIVCMPVNESDFILFDVEVAIETASPLPPPRVAAA